MDDVTELAQLREQIDQIDDRILELLAERIRVVLRIGELKRRAGIPVYDADRERAIYERLCRRAPKPATADIVHSVFERVIDESRRAEQHARREP